MEKPAFIKIFNRFVEEAASLQLTEQIFASVERSQLKVVPRMYDIGAMKNSIENFHKALQNELAEEKLRVCERRVRAELDSWRGNLIRRDEKIAPHYLRRFCEEVEETPNRRFFDALGRFYYFIAHHNASQSKYDFAMTKIFCSERLEGSYRLRFLTVEENELEQAVAALVANWSDSAVDCGEKELEAARQLNELVEEAKTYMSLEDLIQSNVFTRIRQHKTAVREVFFTPHVTAASISCNVVVGNRFNLLIASENAQLSEYLDEANSLFPDIAAVKVEDAFGEKPSDFHGEHIDFSEGESESYEINSVETISPALSEPVTTDEVIAEHTEDESYEEVSDAEADNIEDADSLATLNKEEIEDSAEETHEQHFGDNLYEAEDLPNESYLLKSEHSKDLAEEIYILDEEPSLEDISGYRPPQDYLETANEAERSDVVEFREEDFSDSDREENEYVTADATLEEESEDETVAAVEIPDWETQVSGIRAELSVAPRREVIEEHIASLQSEDLHKLDLDIFLPSSEENVPDEEAALRHRSLSLVLTAHAFVEAHSITENALDEEQREKADALLAEMQNLNDDLRQASRNIEGDDKRERVKPLLFAANQLLESRLKISHLRARTVKNQNNEEDLADLFSELNEAQRAVARNSNKPRILVRDKARQPYTPTPRRKSSSPNLFLVAATILVALLAGATYLFTSGDTTKASIGNSQNVVEIEPQSLNGGEYLKQARVNNQQFVGFVKDDWQSVPNERREQVLKDLLTDGTKRGYNQIVMITSKGEIASSANQQGIYPNN